METLKQTTAVSHTCEYWTESYSHISSLLMTTRVSNTQLLIDTATVRTFTSRISFAHV
jgi:hypothetical protein